MLVWLTISVLNANTCSHVYVCVRLPVQGTLAWDAPGFLWELPTFQLWWIRHLLALLLLFRKGGFREAKQKLEVLRGTEVEAKKGRGEGDEIWKKRWNRRVFVGRLCIMHKWTVPSAESSLHPEDHQRLRLSPHPPPPSASLGFTLKYPSSQHQHYVTMAKSNNWQPVNTTMCVCFRLTTVFPPGLSFPLFTPPRTGKLLVIGCGWIAGGRRGVLCVCSNNVWRRAAGWASSQPGIGCPSQAGRQTDRPRTSQLPSMEAFIIIIVLRSFSIKSTDKII